MKLRRIFLCATFALALVTLGTPHASAQDPNRLAALKVAVWPEFDTPTVLVIVDGTLADKTNLPRQVSVIIPTKASSLVTTFQNVDGSLAAEQTAQTTNLGDGDTRVTFTTQTATYRVEYYDDLLKGAPDKTMEFAFKLPAPADQVTFEIQQPLKATNFAVIPPAQSTRNDADGFKYFTSQFSNVAAGQALTAQVKYTKTDPSPSVVAAPPTNPSTAPAPTPQQPSVWQNVFLGVAIVSLGLVAVFGFFLLRQRARTPVPARQMTRKSSRGTRRPERSASANASAFCTQCGRDLNAEDNFCPRCGAKRRVV